MTRRDMEARGWKELDILLISGDAYVDHPTFAIPLLGRYLESQGYRVGVVAQPDWRSPDSVAVMGRPRLFCGVCSGGLDSMLCHYTAFRKIRHQDAFTPGGESGKRPNRAVLVYTSLVRAAFPGLPVVIGGIEASLRRLAHYDFWSDSLRRSILVDSKADLLIYGMGERQMTEVSRRIAAGESLKGIPGTCHIAATAEEAQLLPAFEVIQSEPRLLLNATRQAEIAVQDGNITLAQAHGNRFVITNPPAAPLTTQELDQLYELPFTRRQHPSYKAPIPALNTVQWSITAMRGCAGGCSFCSLALHQSRHLASRSAESILNEVRRLTAMPDWRGTISDIGGPTANLWGSTCRINGQKCRRHSCLEPNRCPNLQENQLGYLELLRRAKAIPGVKHVEIASGIRHDLAFTQPDFIDGLVGEFVGGHLKLAPEHRSKKVLELMRKPSFALFERFCKLFGECCRKHGKEQYIVPYVMSGFPGCAKEDMRELTQWFASQGWSLEQSQCFIPTPGTMATAMYFCGEDLQGRKIYVPRSDKERLEQHGMLFPKGSTPPPHHRAPRHNSSAPPRNKFTGSNGKPRRGKPGL